jgi:protein RecA
VPPRRKKQPKSVTVPAVTPRRKRTELVSEPEPAQPLAVDPEDGDDIELVEDLYGLDDSKIERFSSGCQILDCVLKGGWAENRVTNIVGDKSTGKTLLAIEACANFNLKHKGDCDIEYIELEEALDEAYARSVGLPKATNFQVFEPPTPVEQIHKRINELIARTNKRPMLVVIDSLDAATDEAEMGRVVGEDTYGTKSKAVSAWFRMQNGAMARANITLFVISQLRDAIGVKFGEKHKRSGGRALDFYATHIVWLYHKGQIKQTRSNVERVIGIDTKVLCKKNKLGPAFRQCSVPILFNFGVEDLEAGLDFLIEVKRTAAVGLSEDAAKKMQTKLDRLTQAEYDEQRAVVNDAVRKVWAEVEKKFAPVRRKYND